MSRTAKPPTAAEHARTQRLRAFGSLVMFACLGILGLVLVSVGGAWLWYASKGKVSDLALMAKHGTLNTPKDSLGDAYEDFFDTPGKLDKERAEEERERIKADAVRQLREEIRKQDPRVAHIQALRERIEKWKAERASQGDEGGVTFRKIEGGFGGR
ncbi:hypothetical protein BHAOGJBA_1301 [Methylobacterium hispanicum]|uniref:Periplasmic heavy metal sensor n=2 Tax=Methylobacterium hispanicum TaxID=270350 RepID=A0AAV4ZI77_9HYPH|nr:hypothetical protein BHAOGJBA_1301 [Methylobacterium hispanicum]